MIHFSKHGGWLTAGIIGWLVVGEACSSGNDAKKTVKYIPDESSGAGRVGDSGAPNSYAGTAAGGAWGGEAGVTNDGEAGSNGEAGVVDVDVDGCGKAMKNCEPSNPDCETSVDTVTSCGACDVHCDQVHGTPICQDSRCVVPAGNCEAGYSDCDEDGSNGCESALSTDPNNCGSCGRVCEGACQSGQCTPVVVVDIGSSIAGEDVYFTDDKVFFSSWNKTGTELGFGARAPASLPGAPTWVATTSVDSLAGDAEFVYLLRNPYGSVHEIRKLAVDGQSPLLQVNEDVGGYTYLRSNATAFFMFTPETAPTSIVTLAKSSTSPPVPISTGRNRIYQMLVTPTKLVWIEGNTPDYNPPIQNIYIGSLAGGNTVKMVPGDLVWDADYYKGDMASDGKYLYWCLYGSSGKILRYELDGSSGPEDLAFDIDRPTSLALDDKYLYFLTGDSSLYRLPKGGGSPELITTNTSYMRYIDLVDTKFVWGHNNNSLGQIIRLPK